MADYAAKAQEWAAKADKRLKSFSLFGGNKYEDAAEMYEKAANQFKLAKACERRVGRVPAGGGGCRQGPVSLRLRSVCTCQLPAPLCWEGRAVSGRPGAALLPSNPRGPTVPPAHPTRPPSCPYLRPAGNEAGETFTKLADVHLKLESKHDAASSWVEAAKAYLKSDRRRECPQCRRPLRFWQLERCGAGQPGRSGRALLCCCAAGAGAAAERSPSAAWRSSRCVAS